MKPPIRRYMAIFAKGREMAQVSIEARSDRAAARIASRMRFRDVGYLTPVVRLESLLRYQHGAWHGERGLNALVERENLRRRAA